MDPGKGRRLNPGAYCVIPTPCWPFITKASSCLLSPRVIVVVASAIGLSVHAAPRGYWFNRISAKVAGLAG